MSDHERRDRWKNGHCDCHAPAMGHVFTDELVCENHPRNRVPGETTRCGITFDAHQANPIACEFEAATDAIRESEDRAA